MRSWYRRWCQGREEKSAATFAGCRRSRAQFTVQSRLTVADVAAESFVRRRSQSRKTRTRVGSMGGQDRRRRSNRQLKMSSRSELPERAARGNEGVKMDCFAFRRITRAGQLQSGACEPVYKNFQLVSVDGLGVREAIARCEWEPHHALLRSNPGISDLRCAQPFRLPSGQKI
jgi:hypothetical protein